MEGGRLPLGVRQHPEEWQAGFVEAHGAWTEFSAAAAAVTVPGPRPVADAADVLHTAMSSIQNAVMKWLGAAQEAGHGRLEEFNSQSQAERPGPNGSRTRASRQPREQR